MNAPSELIHGPGQNHRMLAGVEAHLGLPASGFDGSRTAYDTAVLNLARTLLWQHVPGIYALGPQDSYTHEFASDVAAAAGGQLAIATEADMQALVTGVNRRGRYATAAPLVNTIGGKVELGKETSIATLRSLGAMPIGIAGMPISHALIAKQPLAPEQVKGRRAFTHVQAWRQCAENAQALALEFEPASSTAAAVETLTGPEGRSLLAIGSRKVAERLALIVLDPNFGDLKEGNVTAMGLFMPMGTPVY